MKTKNCWRILGTRLGRHAYDLCACAPSHEWFPGACLSTQNDNDCGAFKPWPCVLIFFVQGILAGRACLVKTYSIIQASKVGLCSNILRVHYHTLSFRALSKTQTWLAGPLPDQSFWQRNKIFPRVFFMDTHLLRTYHLKFNWSDWIVLIKSKILNATGIGLASQFWLMKSTLSFEWTIIFIFRSKSDLV